MLKITSFFYLEKYSNAPVTFVKNKNEKFRFQKKNHGYLVHTCLDNVYRATLIQPRITWNYVFDKILDKNKKMEALMNISTNIENCQIIFGHPLVIWNTTLMILDTPLWLFTPPPYDFGHPLMILYTPSWFCTPFHDFGHPLVILDTPSWFCTPLHDFGHPLMILDTPSWFCKPLHDFGHPLMILYFMIWDLHSNA